MMPGMAGTAQQMATIAASQQMELERIKEGLKPRKARKHILMIGPQGTGKTTVATGIAEIMSLLGVTKSTKVVSVKPTDLEGEYLGVATERLNEKLKETDEGVLLVDEAHQFNNNEFTQNAARALVEPLSNPNLKTVVLFAGYPEEMEKMFREVDPGLRSRFPYRLDFKRANADELFEIAEVQMRGNQVSNKDKKAERQMEIAIDAISEDPEHASGRDVQSLIRYALDSNAQRWSKDRKTPKDVFTAEDWKYAEAQMRNRKAAV